ncbi:MAG: potassium channel protein [Acidimicrobiia bacterium]|nr:potassium channel protein [Acidimicrobiia bacterium]
MSAVARVRIGAAFLALIVFSGTIAYVIIEDVTVFDSFYMVVVTITTVGFAEVIDLSRIGRAVTILLMIVGVGTAVYTFGAALEMALENLGGRGTARMSRQIDNLTDHYIVCGFGKVGAATWEHIHRRTEKVVVIETNPTLAEAARSAGALVVEGDATHNDVLESAGIKRAHSLIACVRDDSDNLVIVLSAKSIQPDLLVISRATEPESIGKLRLAGADRIVSPQTVGARRIAAMALDPNLARFVDLVVEGDLVELRIEQLAVPEGSPLAGATLRTSRIRELSGATILAIEADQEGIQLNPNPDRSFAPGDLLVAIGTREHIDALIHMLAVQSSDDR